MTAKIRYGVITAVWGEEFTRLMARVTLPTNLSPRNLPALAEMADVTYHIYCTEDSEYILRNAAIFPTLARTVAVEFHRIDAAAVRDAATPYTLLSECHRRAVATARDRNEALVILSPDAIWSDGSFARLHELAVEGTRAVMMAAPRAQKADFLRALEPHLPQDPSAPAVLNNRLLMRFLLENLHSSTEGLIWRESELSSWPSQLLWRVGEADLLVRAFHLHPLLIRPNNWHGDMPNTIDGEFVKSAVPDRSQIHIVRDSDEIAACELTTQLAGGVRRTTPNTGSGTRRVAAWMRRSTDSLHRSYVANRIRIHADGIDDSTAEAWAAVEDESTRVLARINRDYAALTVPGSRKIDPYLARNTPGLCAS